jgi:hypothetical protein
MLFRVLSIPVILIGVPVLGYLAICVMLFFRQDRMIFFPTVYAEREFDALGATSGFEPWFDEAGERMGWKKLHPDATRSVMSCHGNGGSAVDRFELGLYLDQGPAVDLYLLEYPGYGARTGAPSESSLVAAAVEAIDALRKTSSNPLWLLGESLGTGVASAAAAQRPEAVDALILVTPFDSLVGAAQTLYPWFPARGLVRHRFDSIKNLAAFRNPVALVIAGDDRTTPPKLGQRLAESIGASSRTWLIEGAGHNDTDLLFADWPQIAAWLAAAGSAHSNALH